MKDFNQVIAEQSNLAQGDKKLLNHIHTTLDGKSIQQLPKFDTFYYLKQKTLKYGSSIFLTLLTGPVTTISILLQTTEKPIFNSIKTKIQGKDLSMTKLIKNGFLGDNSIYKAVKVNSYHDGFQRLGKQGFRGLYKGNLTGIIWLALNTQVRAVLYSPVQPIQNQYIKNLLTIGVCAVTDFITLPLMMCQSRLVLQSSLPNFRTYRSLFDILRRTSPREWFIGSSLLLIKNTIVTLSWMNLIKQSPVYSFVLSTFISHVLTYPIVTIIRNLQTNSNMPMMNNRSQSISQCFRRLKNHGWMSFYRGFSGYAIVHTFLGLIMVQLNSRSGYFEMIN